MKYSLSILCNVVLPFVYTQSSQQTSTTPDLNQYCDIRCRVHEINTRDGQNSVQRQPGPRGPPGLHGKDGRDGPRGLPGPQGPPGPEVNYTIIEEMVKKIIKSIALGELAATKTQPVVTGLSASTTNITVEIPRPTTITQDCSDGFQYRGVCYWTVLRAARNVNFTQAKAICRERSGVPAYPLNEEHYDMMVAQIRERKLRGWTLSYTWIGLRYDPSTGDSMLPDGSIAPYVLWSHKFADASKTRILLFGIGRSLSHMRNASPKNRIDGVICQSSLDP